MTTLVRNGLSAVVIPAALVTAVSAAVPPFPGDLPGTEIGSDLPANYEPSGGAWHPRLQRVFLVHDGGTLTRMTAGGENIRHWGIDGDLEGVAIADPMTDFVYLGVEHPDAIKEFDLASGRVTRTFDLTPWMRGTDTAGLEALAFVPDPAQPEGGVFYAGHQEEGRIYVFRLPIRSSSTSTTVMLENTLGPYSGREDLSGLEWDWQENRIYAIWDSSNVVARLSPTGTLIDEYVLPGDYQEGVAVMPCGLFAMEDAGKEVWRYGFPTSDRDEDSDGVIDCEDVCAGTPAGTQIDSAGCPVAGCSYLPGEVEDVLVTIGPDHGDTVVKWFNPGAGIVFDVASGTLAELQRDGSTMWVDCLAANVSGNSMVDPRVDPDLAVSVGYYYLVRGESTCGAGTYGNTTSGAERLMAQACP